MNYSREELTQTDATMNQMRNAVYELARFMEKNGLTDLKGTLRKMGKDIARTYIRYWKPTDLVNLSNIKDVITTIYQKILNSSVSIEINDIEKLVRVQDSKCALCKYQYDDVEIAGCEIILGMVSEMIYLISEGVNDASSVYLEPFEVPESRAYGNKKCIQIYKYRTGERN
jgi:preprotein translocase subunit SecA